MSTYTPIASITLASAASSVTFSGIPQTYTDLVLVSNTKSTTSNSAVKLNFNGDSATNYSFTYLYGNGTTVASGRESTIANGVINYFITSDSNNFNHNTITHIMNYSNTTTNKTYLSRANNASSSSTYPGTEAIVGLWRSTNAITSLVIQRYGGNFESGSTFNLYGIANASITNVAKATGGDSVYTDGTYWYHIFRSSGVFTPTQALTADYLVVAGGGSGGSGNEVAASENGGGGGAGGMRCTVTATGGGGSLESALSLTAQAYTVTIGAGGASISGSRINGNPGSNSTFATITATGGGYGGRGGNVTAGDNGGTGGSGGGGGAGGSGGGPYSQGGTRTASPVQGFNGGNGNESAAAGGGGGAGAVGLAGTSAGSVGGNGGGGIATSISGSSVTYAGGGGGGGYTTKGTGGSGGGGDGSARTGTVVATNGSANTGGGGGGAGSVSSVWTSGAGGSGIVIIRYSAAA